jgi:hypothetical protein
MMKTVLKKAVATIATGATLFGMAAPVAARDGHYGHGHGGYESRQDRGDVAGAAIAGGIVGLVLGAAIASSKRDDRGYYDDGYRRTYYRSDYRRDYDRGDYYRRGYAYDNGYYRHCRTHRYYDDHRGWTTVQRCR